ncbi:hypothetical protein [Porphyromonas endodontalis]|uniref:hypothetical protein n=1 Tax=Porphyromonas endodontalis TaxID=28124 RepID=UPI00360B818B
MSFGEGAGLVYGGFCLLVTHPKKARILSVMGMRPPLIMDIGIGKGTAYLDLITHRCVVYAVTIN